MASINLSERQLELLRAVVEVMKADIDWTKVAEIANFSSGKYARDTWIAVRKKLVSSDSTAPMSEGGEENGTAGGTPTGKAKKATPRKRKNGDNDDDEASPAKKKATPRKGKKEAPKEDEDGDDDDAAVKTESNEAGEVMDDMK